MTALAAKHTTGARSFAGLEVAIPAEQRSRIDFALGLRRHWANALFGALRAQAGTAGRDAFIAKVLLPLTDEAESPDPAFEAP